MFSHLESKYVDIPLGDSAVRLTAKLLCYQDPIAGGNKYYKLKYNLLRAKELGLNHVVTVGGAFSNHLAATARACHALGIRSTGIVRGEQVSNNTLNRAVADGMELVFVSRERYRTRYETGFAESVLGIPADWWFIPEGGSNNEGVQGCREILEAPDECYDWIVICCATGSTAIGVSQTLKPHQSLSGICVLRNAEEITGLFHDNPKVEIHPDFHFGGYAKTTLELDTFCKDFTNSYGIDIEPVYTGKMFFGLHQLISEGRFEIGARILAIHTGGLQYLT